MDELVSVIIPVYNAGEYLERCLNSLEHQIYKKIEILLIEDGSTDNSPEVCDRMAEKFENVSAIHRKNGGVASARNEGLRKASGSALMFVDADDWVEPDMVAVLQKALRDNACEAAVGDYIREYDSGFETHQYREKDVIFENQGHAQIAADVLLPQSGIGFVWGKLFDRNFLIKKDLFLNEKLAAAEDAEYMLRCMDQAERISYVARPLYHYFFNSSSAVRKFRKDYVIRYRNSMEAMKNYLDSDSARMIYRENWYSCVNYHLLLCVVNYYFHPERKDTPKEQIQELKKDMSEGCFAEAMKHVRLSDFSLARKVTMFFLQHHLYGMVRMVAAVRHMQFRKMSRK